MLATAMQLEEYSPPGAGDNNFPYRIVLPVIITIVLTVIAEYIWWEYSLGEIKHLPTSKCKNHIMMASRVLASLAKNQIADSNVLFFQLLQGMVAIHQQQKIGLFYAWTGLRPVVMCFDPDILEAILKSPNNLQKSFDYTFLSLWLKEGLVTSVGNKWKNRRKLITSAFHFRILENFVYVFDKQSRYMVQKLRETKATEKGIDILPYITMCTLDTICETAMGINIHAQDDHNSAYVQRMHKTCEAFVSRVFRPWLWPSFIFFNTRSGKEFIENTAAMDKFTRQDPTSVLNCWGVHHGYIGQTKRAFKLRVKGTREVITNRKAEIIEKKKNCTEEVEDNKKKAFLDLLLDMHFSDPKNFTEADIQEEVDSFMFAGHDTTAVGTGWTLYMLGLHQDIQKKVVDEMDSVFGDDMEKPITEELLKDLRYLDLVIKETQRIFPPAPYIGRQLQESVTVNGYKIPKGTTCMLIFYMLHRDPQHWDNPEKFDPDRFLPENSVNRHPFAYLPFSAGPRSCIGQKFAMLEEKTILVNILRNFRVESVEERDKLFISAELVLRTRGGVKLRLIPRER